jgi:hypothetical protein
LPPHRDNPGTTHEEPVYLFTDQAVSPGEGVRVPPPGPAGEGHPLLGALLTETPRIRQELPGWAAGHLVPALDAFPDDPTEAQLASALANLRQVLHGRADIDPWLAEVAKLGAAGPAGDWRAMTPASQLDQHIELSDRVRNRIIVEQARQLAAALTSVERKAEDGPTTPPQPRPDP